MLVPKESAVSGIVSQQFSFMTTQYEGLALAKAVPSKQVCKHWVTVSDQVEVQKAVELCSVQE